MLKVTNMSDTDRFMRVEAMKQVGVLAYESPHVTIDIVESPEGKVGVLIKRDPGSLPVDVVIE